MKGSGRVGLWMVILVGLALLVGAPGRRVAGQSLGTMRPLGEFLAVDGALALPPGAYGSFDATGYHLVSDPHGPPRFVPAKSHNSSWAEGFLSRGLSESYGPYVLAADQAGNLYVGGSFLSAGNCTSGCVGIARWDGTSWSSLDGGIDPARSVNTLVVDSHGVLYAGGTFNGIGTCDSAAGCNTVARWDGNAWSPLGNGINHGWVKALAVDGSGVVYAGGDFHRAGACDTGCTGIARWNGITWESVGGGTDSFGRIEALMFDGSGALYAGGAFQAIGSCNHVVGCKNIARWDGTSWSPLGSGTNNTVYTLAWGGNDELYAGGHFT
jgi:trimeric autotransporter adhesin